MQGNLRRWWAIGCAMLVLAALLTPLARADTTLPEGFRETVAFSGLLRPTAVRFAGDGSVFVAEKSGIIKHYDSLADTTPAVFADLRTQVYNYADRGLLGLAIDPHYPIRPYVYALYSHDALPGGQAPHWGASAGQPNESCPTPPGATADGCVVTGRLSRLEKAAGASLASEHVLIEDWCQQFTSHSIGDLAFGADGALYASGGDGASYTRVDYGQSGGSTGSPTPLNPCSDPPGGSGDTLAPPSAEGGALRSQDLRTSSDPAGLDGTIIRIDPDTGAAKLDNPLAGNADTNAARIVAYGLRNPFRMAVRPGTNDIWVGDVGWNEWEEINRVPEPRASVLNFGWPCYEGDGVMRSYANLGLNLCSALYTENSATDPLYTYHHLDKVVAGETCGTGGSSTAGLAFYDGGIFPPAYDGALFFADYSRQCIWLMYQGSNGLPDPSRRASFATAAASPVDLEVGPDGSLYYVDLVGGSVRRIAYHDGNQPPVAKASADRTSGAAPLSVHFDAAGSHDPESGALTYAWDLDGDGAFDDSSAPRPVFSYSAPGNYAVRLRVTDAKGVADTSATLTIMVGNTPPVPAIAGPAASARWIVGQQVEFSGTGSDQQDGNLAAAQLDWELVLHHCVTPSSCHAHPLERFNGVKQGSFVAPDHEYPSFLELVLTATDSKGASASSSVRIAPQTSTLTLETEPVGLQLSMGSTTNAAPLSQTVLVNSANSVIAASPQFLNGSEYVFESWSDGGAQTHFALASGANVKLTARYRRVSPPDTAAPGITLLAARNVDSVSAQIVWTTDEPAISSVEYGPTPGFGARSASNAPLNTEHAFQLAGLAAGTTYYYRAVSTDAEGNTTGATGTFTTAARPSALPNAGLRFIPLVTASR